MGKENDNILFVDDEPTLLESYSSILGWSTNDKVSEVLSLIEKDGEAYARENRQFNVFLASSGAEAVEIVKKGIEEDNPIAVGFFDMRMPGMDGFETIRTVRELDPRILCAIVTAYSDRACAEIRELFPANRQDEWLFFKKPFNPEELVQAAINLICSWNRRRREEEYIESIEYVKNGLKYILKAVANLSRIPPVSVDNLISGILYQISGLLRGENGLICVLGKEGLKYGQGIGCYKDVDEEIILRDTQVRKAIDSNELVFNEKRCIIPLKCDNDQLGIIIVESEVQRKALLKELLEVFKNQIINLILNSKFYDELLSKDRETISDPLTGLYNRRFLFQRLQTELKRSSRFNFEVTLLMVDIDDFKNINDTYGHEVGDYVLEEIGTLLASRKRGYDLAGRLGGPEDEDDEDEKYAIRYGGEEFIMVYPQTTIEDAKMLGEKLRQAIERHSFYTPQGDAFGMTATIGIAHERIEHERGNWEHYLQKLISDADNALYKGKSLGKNRVVAGSS